MSNFEGPLASQPEWQGHYSYLPPGEPNIFGQPFQQASGSNASNAAAAVPRPSNTTNTAAGAPSQSGPSATGSPLAQTHHVAAKVESPRNELPEARAAATEIKTEKGQEESPMAAAPADLSNSNALSSTSPSRHGQEHPQSQDGNDDTVLSKEEDDDLDDDDMLDVEGDGEGETRAMTAAERTAARRKMKRFR